MTAIKTITARRGSFPATDTAELFRQRLTVTFELAHTHLDVRTSERVPFTGSIRNNNFKTPVYVNELTLELDEPITGCTEVFQLFVGPVSIEAGCSSENIQLGDIEIPYDCPPGEYCGRLIAIGGLFGDQDYRGSRQLLGDCRFLVRVMAGTET